MDLVSAVYRLTTTFPRQEEYRLTSQLARAVVSVPANIAEGQRRSSRKDYSHFVGIAHGSLAEVETLLLIAERIQIATSDQIKPLLQQADEISRMLHVMRQKLSAPA